jgi:hypothetical protein
VQLFHITSGRNRGSILSYGLDWTLMADAPGIAGSRAPEQPGCFLCRHLIEACWFIEINNTGGPVDVWAVVGIDETELVQSSEGVRPTCPVRSARTPHLARTSR